MSTAARLASLLAHASEALRSAYEEVPWADGPLGEPATWPDTLVDSLSVVLGTRFPASLCWGPDLVLLYNESYAAMIGAAHPGALGRPYADTFSSAWDEVGPLVRHAAEGRGSTWSEDALVPLQRAGYVEHCWFTFSCSPVRGADSGVAGVLVVASETTATVLARRRSQALARLDRDLGDVRDERALLRRVVGDLRAHAGEDLVEVGVADGRAPDIGLTIDPGQHAGDDRGPRARIDLPVQHPSAAPRHLVVRLNPHLRFDDEYRTFVASVATTVARALDVVVVRDSQQRLSEALQRSLLTQPHVEPEVDVAVRYEPAALESAVGGDWYDAFSLPDGAVAVVVGDVAGHDQHAAAVMGQLRNLVRGVAYAGDAWLPSQVLGDVDRAMEGLGVPALATAVVGVLEEQGPDGYLLHWCNAGHPPPVLRRVDGSVEVLDEPADVLLGVDGTPRRRDHRAVLAPGDLVLLYTDGLVERRDRGIDEGVTWLAEAVAAGAHEPPDALCTRLLGLVDGHEDDVVLLAVRPRPV
ncbi:SpoIIE family protein phosphatase [Nocardioides bruguierae]|uniref:SpoIIE family protein phosphatase n=1 Tax=Nocardioides bruguierae TaxID=2945102 RepID=UPI0020221A20|nr:SpoIIE family protein phosphatase [Nocardioides bruguierae]MCL8024924.1 SpoIIE family protein phosphatase [Nocardioides bruguierae]